jgi:ssDNA-binding Zn-finger/Zn-ribbon topoisomerase 1
MAKTEECDRCQRFSGYSGSSFLVCAIYPQGPAQSPCPDYAEVAGQREALGAAYYADELVVQPEHYLTTEERWVILNTHPLFTGICPKCKRAIAGSDLIHYDCENCGWKNDSVA